LLKSIKNKIYLTVYLSFLFTFGIDNSLSLFSDFILYNLDSKSFFLTNNYLKGLIILILIFTFNFLFIKYLNKNGIKIITIFISTILFYNFFYSDKSFKNFPEFNNLKVEKTYNETTLIFILDQMAGINSVASSTKEGNYFDNYVKNFSKENNAKIYENIFSSCFRTRDSISFLVNFYNPKNPSDCIAIENNLIKNSKNFYNKYNMHKNALFELFDSISVFQNYFINYCNHKNVNKCDQYTQFKSYEYIDDFNSNNFSLIISGWKHYGSIFGNIIWRTLLQFKFISSYDQSSGEKGSFLSRLDAIENDFLSKKYDLIFFHSLASHEPYAFDKNCNFKRENFINYRTYNYDKKLLAHNLDRICIIEFIDQFLLRIKKKDNTIKTNLIILSDHGTRIKSDPNDELNSIFIYKKNNGFFERVLETENIQNVFKKIFLDTKN